ncbi:MAG: XRE family transcriptional regulator [Phascolarctobacterium sp.]|nr:XRE family transcriptional regulator [Phascolarctobacterium sp.]
MKAKDAALYINPKHVGSLFDEFLTSNLREEEIKVIQAKAKLLGEIIDARQELLLTQKKLEALSGIKQPMIAKIENGNVNPSLDSLLHLLVSMNKTIKVVPI